MNVFLKYNINVHFIVFHSIWSYATVVSQFTFINEHIIAGGSILEMISESNILRKNKKWEAKL